jgi:hypothetical protein
MNWAEAVVGAKPQIVKESGRAKQIANQNSCSNPSIADALHVGRQTVLTTDFKELHLIEITLSNAISP